MPAVPTKSVEIDGITINIPVGSLDPPTAESEAIMRDHHDPRGWKYPMRPFATMDAEVAADLAYCYGWYLGGHEHTIEHTRHGQIHIVNSKGYYHYVGA